MSRSAPCDASSCRACPARILALNFVLLLASPIVVALVAFGLHVLTGDELTAAQAFTSLALFNARQPLRMPPKIVQGVMDAQVRTRGL